MRNALLPPFFPLPPLTDLDHLHVRRQAVNDVARRARLQGRGQGGEEREGRSSLSPLARIKGG